MSDLIAGRVGTPPGTLHPIPPGTPCDKHPDVLSRYRVQGDTDADSAVLHDMCDFCYQTYLMQAPEQEGGCCEWCGKFAKLLQDYRDAKEGFAGPIYQVCEECIHQDQENIVDDLPSQEDGFNVNDADPGLNDDDTYFHDEGH
jgi:hypothetical protein